MLMRNQKVWCGIVIAQLFFVILLGFFYDRREPVELYFSQDDLVDSNGVPGFYIDKSSGIAYVATPELALPKGMYTLEATYEYAGEVRLEVQYLNDYFDANAGGLMRLNATGNTVCDFRVKYDRRPLHIRGRLAGDAGDQDYLLIRELKITTAAVGTRNAMFRAAVLLLLLDLLLVLYLWRERLFGDAETRNQCKLLFLLICFSSLPLTVNYLYGMDLGFHLVRIEGIKDGLLNGAFPVKILPNWLGGHGYAASVFYGDLLLYIPAVLRLFGVSVQAAYQFYVLFVNILTVLISYYCFAKMSGRWNGLLCSALYTLNIFRLYDLYSRAAVGEYTAMAFMPLVLYGLWKVYKLPEDSKEHSRSWITIMLGCSGVFLSHMISTEMTALYVIVIAVILGKKTFRRKNLAVLLKAAAATVAVNLWFLLPFLDYMMNETFALNMPGRYDPYRLESKGGFPVQLFMTEYNVTEISGAIDARGASSNMPLTMGNAVMLILIGWFLLCAGQKERDLAERKEEYLAVSLSVFCILTTQYFFPYTWLVEKIPLLTFPVYGLQFQWRFFLIAVVILLWLLCIVMKKEWIGRKKKMLFAGALLLLSVFQSVSFISKLMNEKMGTRIYQEAGVDIWDIGFGEYLPMGTIAATDFSIGDFTDACREELAYDAACVNVEEWHREKGRLLMQVQNTSGENQQVEVPLLLYKGYRAVSDSGEQLPLSYGDHSRISVTVPAGYAGGIQIGFHEPWYWRVSEIISLLALIGIVLYCVGFPKKGKRKAEQNL